MTEPAPLIETRALSKVYPDGTAALQEIDMAVRAGHVHGLLGENGAGKTTLTKILSGLLAPTAGELRWRGRPIRFATPREALGTGIGMVHQHFALVEPFTGLENIALGQEPGRRLSRSAMRRLQSRVERIMSETGLRAPLNTPIERLPLGVQQRVEILKILSRDVELLILDEPTAVLTPQEADELFETLDNLRAQGKTVVFITHKLKEVKAVTDRITVLRGGRVVDHVDTADATPESLSRMMVGRDVRTSVEPSDAEPGATLLRVSGLCVPGDADEAAVDDLAFEVRAGELFAIAGVQGNGQTELIEALTGLRPWHQGEAAVDGTGLRGLRPAEIFQAGVAHIPEDRRKHGLILEFTLLENSVLGRHRRPPFSGRDTRLRWGRIAEHTRNLIERYSIQAASAATSAGSLSGGNQQKLVVGRELSKAPKLVIAAHPTRGLDVGAAQYIRDVLVELRSEGVAILLVSADLDEIFQLADRVGVMYEGRFTGILESDRFDRGLLGLLMGGVPLEEALHRTSGASGE